MLIKRNFVLAGLLIVLVVFPRNVRGELPERPFGWSDPVLITHGAIHYHDLGADSDGNFWVLWTSRGSYHLMLEKYDRQGNRILGPVQVDDGGRVGSNGMGVDPNTADVFLFWDDGRDYAPGEGAADIYCAKFDAEGNKVWGDVRVTYTGFGGGYSHRVAVDSEGAAHAIRVKATGSGFSIGYTKVLPDGTLKHAYKSVLFPIVFVVDRPGMSIDANDHLHVIWGHQEGSPVDPMFVQYMKLDNEGDPLFDPIRLSPDDCADGDLVVDSKGNIHVVWTHFVGYNPPWTTSIYYCKLDNDGAVILQPRQVNQDVSTGVYSSIVLDHNDRAHILWNQISKLVNPVPWSTVAFAGMRHIGLDGLGRPVGREEMIFLGRGAWLGWTNIMSNPFGDLLVLNPYYELFENRHTLELLRTLPQETCRVGAVRLGTGEAAEDVLYVNGSAGDPYREIQIPQGAPLSASLRGLAEEPGGARYVIHASLRLPDEDSATLLPKGVGLSCFDLQLPPYGTGNPAAIWNSGMPQGRVGASRYFDGTPIPNPRRAPAVFLNLPSGDPVNLPSGTAITFQGVMEDWQSAGAIRASVTNAVIVKIL